MRLYFALIMLSLVIFISCTTQQTSVTGDMVEITDSGYVPKVLTVKQGTTVTWTNTGERANWPATAVHPSHRAYPGSDIKKCRTDEKDIIFDACGGIAKGESYSFTFNEKGSWPYHDHLNPGMTGTIIVE